MTKTRLLHITTARSDYGPCHWLLHDLFHDPRFDLELVVSGSHLSSRLGHTIEEIAQYKWGRTIEIPFFSEDPSETMGTASARAMSAFTRLLREHQPHLVVVYGDRFELLPFVSSCVFERIPIAHLCGGDTTEGAIDEQVRHAVTKMAHLHFPSSPRSARRVLQMGEEPWRIHCVGDPGIDAFKREAGASPQEIADSLGFYPDRDTLLVTLHPVTLPLQPVDEQVREVVAGLEQHKGPIIITGPAPDPGAEIVRTEMLKLAQSRPRTFFVEHLGSYKYRGLMSMVGAMAGNSSSALMEAPCVPLPALNIGPRQQGRERGGNVVDVPYQRSAITQGLVEVLSPRFRDRLAGMTSPYGNGDAVPRIMEVLSQLPSKSALMLKKFCHSNEEAEL